MAAIRYSTRPGFRRGDIWIVLACIFAVLVLACAYATSKAGIESLAGMATGTHVSLGRERVGLTSASLDDVTVHASSGEPLLHVAHVDAQYNIRDLLPGGKRLFGLRAFNIVDPQITLIRHKDGTWNYSLPSPSKNAAPGPPMDFDGRISNGSATIIDESQGVPGARELHADAFNADLHMHPARSQYRIAANYIESGRVYHVSGNGDINPSAGYSAQHIHVPPMPIARLVDFGMNSPSMHLASGEITGTDLRIVGLPDGKGGLQSHIMATTLLRDVRVAVGGLGKPLRDVHGRVDVYDNGMIFDGVDGTLANVPLSMRGGIYDLSQPHFRIALQMHGDVAQLRGAIAQAAHLRVHGNINLAILLEGAASNMLAMIAVDGKRIDFAGQRIDAPHGLIAFNQAEVDLLDVHARWHGASAGAQGRVAFTKRPNGIEVIAGAQAPSSSLPYIPMVLPGMPLGGMMLATANDPKQIETRGVLHGVSRTQRIAAAFSVTSDGVGTVGPLIVDGANGTVYGQIALDHPHAHASAFVDAQNFRMLGGRVALNGDVLGTLDHDRISALTARARVHGSLDAIDAMMPGASVSGTLDAPVLAISDGNEIIAQIDGAQFHHASVRGVTLQGVNATVASDLSGHVRVLAANARVNGRDILANGTFGSRGSSMAITAGRMPVMHGAVSAAALVGGTAKAPVVSGAVVANGVQYGSYGIGGLASLQYQRSTLRVRDTAVDAGPALVTLDGTVARPGTSSQSYDVAARAHAVHLQQQLVDAYVDADVRARGTGMTPYITGLLSVPTGSVNGQGFRDLRATLNGTPSALAVSNGSVMVNTTNVAFSGIGNAMARGGTISVRAPHADLSDFNDLFDTGETLAGTGSVAMTASYAPGVPIVTNGAVNIANLRYRRFDIGSANANWRSSSGAVQFVASAGGANGVLRANGSVNPATYAMTANANVSRLNLQNWLPMIGMTVPVVGRVDANATVAGRFPDMNSRLNARVLQGMAWGVPLEQATLAMHMAGGRGSIDRAVIRIPNAAADASGTFGLHAHDPLALVAHASTPNIGAVAREAGMKMPSLAGRAQMTATVRGTRVNPQLTNTATVDDLTYQKLRIPHASAQVAATMRRVTLQRGEVDLAPGRLMLAGSAPFPLRNAAFNASVLADDIELAQFAPLLPTGTKLAGRIDGRVNANGRTDNPQFSGLMTFANGSFSGPQEEVPITGMGAQLALSGTRMNLRNTHASVGGGTITASGTASVPSVRDVGAAAFNFQANASHARVDAPAYYKGLIDASLTASRVPRGLVGLGGTVTLSSARIPLTALFNPNASKAPAGPPLPIAFNNLHIVIGRDVRVQSPNVDVGGEGGITIAGTLTSPRISGSAASTGGTVSFYRDFNIEHARVAFDGSGVIPYINATATTYITDPSTNIRIHVTGPATDMNLALSSDPSYDRSQILGLLAGMQQFGAVQGVATTSGGSKPNAFNSLAAGQLNTVFTRNLLEPLSNALGGAFGFDNVQLSNSLTGGFGANVTKVLGKSLSASFAENFGSPRRQSMTFETLSHKAISLRTVFYTQDQPIIFGTNAAPATTVGTNAIGGNILSIQPMSGTNGFDLNLTRKFACPGCP